MYDVISCILHFIVASDEIYLIFYMYQLKVTLDE